MASPAGQKLVETEWAALKRRKMQDEFLERETKRELVSYVPV